jgi:hypothetical protein
MFAEQIHSRVVHAFVITPRYNKEKTFYIKKPPTLMSE